jgi:hypothetical protein
MVKKASTGSITSKMAMSAPASARPSAKARPQPRAPPVTRAVRPLSENWELLEEVLLVGDWDSLYPFWLSFSNNSQIQWLKRA